MFSKIKEYIRQSKGIGQDEEFYNIYRELEPEILSIENKRKKSVIKIASIYILIIVLSILFITICNKLKVTPIINLLFVIAIFIIIMKSTSNFVKEKAEYINSYKSDILIKVLQKINKDKVNFQKDGINIRDYLQAGFETKGIFNEYKSSDYIGIKIKENIIHLSNIELNYKEIVKDRTVTTNIFSGIYAYIPINKNLKTIRVEKSLQNLMAGKGQIILDNQHFEKYFNIFSEDRMLTMQVLTPQVMDKMLEFIQNNFINLEIIIKDNKIHFKFYTQITSPPLLFSLTKSNEDNKRYIYYYYSIFKFIIEMTEYLSNTINELNM